MVWKHPFSALAALGLAAVLAAPVARASVTDKTAIVNGEMLHYRVVLPEPYDPAKAYPAVLAFPPGSQDREMVDVTLRDNYRAEAEKRGYIVIEAAAPDAGLFFEQGGKVFPDFLTKILAGYKIADNKFNAAGNSNGGLSAFAIAARYPQYFWSVTGFPGFLDSENADALAALGTMCIHMFAGERDSGWPDWMKEQAEKLKARGFRVTFAIEKDQPHVIRTLTGKGAARLFDQFDAARQGHCAQ